MYFHVYLIYRFTRTFTDHSSVITRCWGFELQNGKSSLKSPQTLATQDFAPASFLSTPDNLPFRHTSELGGIPEWPKGADCKSVVSDFGGSNPPSPTKKIVTPYGVTIFLFERRADPPSPPKPPAVFRIHPFPPNSTLKSISITS